MKVLRSLEEFDDLIGKGLAGKPEEEILSALDGVFLKLPGGWKLGGDPFSDEYHKGVLEILCHITGVRDYSPEVNELTPFLTPDLDINSLFPYNYDDSKLVGDFVVAYGAVLKRLDVKKGDRVLEYGAGVGPISVALARMGCDVSVVDIDENYLKTIEKQNKLYGINIRLKKGLFGENINPGDCYDRILFFEAFHHALEHRKVLAGIYKMLKDDGMIVFAGEPIIEEENLMADYILPYPWGPRLDGVSLRSMRLFGWCELGFREKYFLALLDKFGFSAAKHACAESERGSAYTARKR
ncbi:MAG: class I SAM-dependent methyltransferase [Thermodesulfobacteriota bacterium]